ncbi:unnamed protein product, partial [Arabidopsis halleri]
GISKKNLSPSLFDDFNWHSYVWQVKTSLKVKHFLWKAAIGSLPAGDQLLIRGIPTDARSRNQLLFEDRRFSEDEAIQKAVQETRIWQQAQWDLAPAGPSTLHSSMATFKSSLPLANSIQIETDAAWSENNLLCGLGWIGRSSHGSSIFKGSAFSTHVLSALTGEAIAVREALLEALSKNYLIVHIKSDSKVLMDLLRSNAVINELVGLLHDIRSLVSVFSAVSFTFIPRAANSLADSIAKDSLASLVLSSSLGVVIP